MIDIFLFCSVCKYKGDTEMIIQNHKQKIQQKNVTPVEVEPTKMEIKDLSQQSDLQQKLNTSKFCDFC